MRLINDKGKMSWQPKKNHLARSHKKLQTPAQNLEACRPCSWCRTSLLQLLSPPSFSTTSSSSYRRSSPSREGGPVSLPPIIMVVHVKSQLVILLSSYSIYSEEDRRLLSLLVYSWTNFIPNEDYSTRQLQHQLYLHYPLPRRRRRQRWCMRLLILTTDCPKMIQQQQIVWHPIFVSYPRQ